MRKHISNSKSWFQIHDMHQDTRSSFVGTILPCQSSLGSLRAPLVSHMFPYGLLQQPPSRPSFHPKVAKKDISNSKSWFQIHDMRQDSRRSLLGTILPCQSSLGLLRAPLVSHMFPYGLVQQPSSRPSVQPIVTRKHRSNIKSWFQIHTMHQDSSRSLVAQSYTVSQVWVRSELR